MTGVDLEAVARYYAARLAAHGATAGGVDWNSEASQTLRFEQLVRLWEPGSPPDGILDWGCGVGALLTFLRGRGYTGAYAGFDIEPSMIDCGRGLHRSDAGAIFTTDAAALPRLDAAVASGVLNVKLDHDDEAWTAHVHGTLDELATRSRRGFAFNVLTAYADPGRRRADLYYADPLELFAHCRRRYSPRVALLHDYPLFEFTMLVRTKD